MTPLPVPWFPRPWHVRNVPATGRAQAGALTAGLLAARNRSRMSTTSAP